VYSLVSFSSSVLDWVPLQPLREGGGGGRRKDPLCSQKPALKRTERNAEVVCSMETDLFSMELAAVPGLKELRPWVDSREKATTAAAFSFLSFIFPY
jgi:hypothetical protein